MIAASDAPPGVQCRICQSDDDCCGPLLSPCRCDGSVRWVHASCLSAWRSKGGGSACRAAECELCRCEFRYELRRAAWPEALLTSARAVGDYTLSVLGLVLLGLCVSAASGSPALWAVWMEPSGCQLFLLAFGDFLLPLAEAVLPEQCCAQAPQPDHDDRRHRAARAAGPGVLLRACGRLLLVLRLGGAELSAHAEQHAQEEAALQAEEAVRCAAEGSVAEGVAREGIALGGLISDGAMATADVATVELLDSVDAQSSSHASGWRGNLMVLWSLGCFARVFFFCGFHGCLGIYWWCIKQGFGFRAASWPVRAAGLIGSAYWLLAAAVLCCAALLGGPLLAVYGEDGLPVVRSLTPEEREPLLYAWDSTDSSSDDERCT